MKPDLDRIADIMFWLWQTRGDVAAVSRKMGVSENDVIAARAYDRAHSREVFEAKIKRRLRQKT